MFNSKLILHDHLGSSGHRENTEAILSKFKSSYDCRENNDGYYCKACQAYCPNEATLASHLVGRKHRRQTLQGRETFPTVVNRPFRPTKSAMKFACRGRPTAVVADDVDDSHPPGFPGPPPPDDVDDSRPPGFPAPQPPSQDDDNLAVTRRMDKLMWELQLERMREDMISRQLAATECAMALRFGPPSHWPLQALPPSQDYWHHRRPLELPPWDEAALRTLRAVTQPPSRSCGSLAPVAARVPPVYPHVERSPSPSPVPQSPHAGDGDQQQESGSPGLAARQMLSCDLEGCRSPSKQILLEGGACHMLMMSVALVEEVTPGERRPIVGEPKQDVEDGCGVQPCYRSENHSSEQRETAQSTMEDQTDGLLVWPCQDRPASRENGASDEQKKIVFTESPSKLNLLEGALVSAAANAGAKTSSVSFAEETTPGDQCEVGWQPKHRVEDGYGEQTTMSVGSTMKGETGDQPVAWLSQYRSASEVIGGSNEWKRLTFKERTPRARWLKRKLTTTSYSPVTTKKKKQKLPKWICDLCQRRVSLFHPTNMAQHLASKRHLSKLKAMNTLVEATPTPGSSRNGDESVAENGGGGGNAPRPVEEPLSMWASLVLPEFRSSYNIHTYDGPENSVYYCKACYAYFTGDTTLALHLVGKRHRRKTLQGRQCDAGTGKREALET
ncbi:hypothetical protein QOZ80_6AG0535500 [Eleusine coracana subsp. coracana]|nr:hypothetical protein QOZ80_6AG0535500 [Eleusine coracana subsp. coracana]